MTEIIDFIPVIAEEILSGKPVPHYLTGEVKVGTDKLSLEATAIFPSSEPSLGQRGHVNQFHYLAGVWDAAHILGEMNDLIIPLALHSKIDTSQQMGFPDQPMAMNFEITKFIEDGDRINGWFRAVYKNSQGKTCAIVEWDELDKPGFVAKRKRQITVQPPLAN